MDKSTQSWFRGHLQPHHAHPAARLAIVVAFHVAEATTCTCFVHAVLAMQRK